MVGDRELEIIQDCFDRVKNEKGQALSIVAEAGMGKSRLLYEFRKYLANEDITFLEGRCLSYGQNIPYLPVIDILKSNFRIDPDDNPKEISEKVEKGWELIDPNADRAISQTLSLSFRSIFGGKRLRGLKRHGAGNQKTQDI